jgi:hypothetical protein
MPLREIPLRRRVRELELDQHVFVLPRSADPGDYGVITTLDDDELLRRGLRGQIRFHGFKAALESSEREVKRFFRELLKRRVGRRNQRRRWLRSAFLPLLLLILLAPPLGDEVLFGAGMIVVVALMHRAQQREHAHRLRVVERLDRVEVRENPLLTAIHESLASLDGSEYRLVDFEAATRGMDPEEVDVTVEAIRRYLALAGAGPIGRRIERLSARIAGRPGVRSLLTRAVRLLQRARLAIHGGRVQGGLEPAYYTVYEDVLLKAEAARRRAHGERHWDIFEPLDMGAESVAPAGRWRDREAAARDRVDLDAEAMGTGRSSESGDERLPESEPEVEG